MNQENGSLQLPIRNITNKLPETTLWFIANNLNRPDLVPPSKLDPIAYYDHIILPRFAQQLIEDRWGTTVRIPGLKTRVSAVNHTNAPPVVLEWDQALHWATSIALNLSLGARHPVSEEDRKRAKDILTRNMELVRARSTVRAILEAGKVPIEPDVDAKLPNLTTDELKGSSPLVRVFER